MTKPLNSAEIVKRHGKLHPNLHLLRGFSASLYTGEVHAGDWEPERPGYYVAEDGTIWRAWHRRKCPSYDIAPTVPVVFYDGDECGHELTPVTPQFYDYKKRGNDFRYSVVVYKNGSKPGETVRKRALPGRVALQAFTRKEGGSRLVGYRDRDPENCSIDNLYWRTKKEKIPRSFTVKQKLRVEDLNDIARRWLFENDSFYAIADDYNCHPATVKRFLVKHKVITDKNDWTEWNGPRLIVGPHGKYFETDIEEAVRLRKESRERKCWVCGRQVFDQPQFTWQRHGWLCGRQACTRKDQGLPAIKAKSKPPTSKDGKYDEFVED